MTPFSRTDGIRTSQRPLGRVAQRWLAILDGVDVRIRPRVVRGRTLARGARVRELELAPGAALGEVRDQEVHRPTLRVRTFDEQEWARIVELLCFRLDLLASLFEGEVADELLGLLEERGLPLLPDVREIDGDCDCGDWAVPCAHGAAIHHILGEALEGEPFLLFTLRGRPREQLLTDLRRAWGDAGTRIRRSGQSEEPLPEGDAFGSPVPVPTMSFRFGTSPAASAPGMVELGPLVGDEDLARALQPLYDAGAAHALELALAGEAGERGRPRRAGRHREPSTPPLCEDTTESEPLTPAPVAPVPVRRPPPPARELSPDELAELLVDAVAEAEDGLSVDELVEQLGLSDRVLGKELLELERMGLLSAVDSGGLRRYHLG